MLYKAILKPVDNQQLDRRRRCHVTLHHEVKCLHSMQQRLQPDDCKDYMTPSQTRSSIFCQSFNIHCSLVPWVTKIPGSHKNMWRGTPSFSAQWICAYTGGLEMIASACIRIALN